MPEMKVSKGSFPKKKLKLSSLICFFNNMTKILKQQSKFADLCLLLNKSLGFRTKLSEIMFSTTKS